MTQTDMFSVLEPKSKWEEKANAWIHTPEGGEIMNRFIRMAIGLRKSGFETFGAKAICERLRWHYIVRNRNSEEDQEKFKINNNYTSFMSRYAALSCSELDGFFRMREIKEKVV